MEAGAITKNGGKGSTRRRTSSRGHSARRLRSGLTILRFTLQPGDILLLCSDSLSNMVTDLEMLESAKEYQDPELICRALMSKALIRGARDNVTVVAVMR